MKFQNILETIGKTPHVRLSRLFPGHQVWLKLERNNPGGSIKDRIALAMIETAESAGLLSKDSHIIEPTSGNTGIGLALVCAVKGYALTLVMPESMSLERRAYLKALGANLVLTPRELGMKGAIEKAKDLLQSTNLGWMPMQFSNPANPEAHKKTTAIEIYEDFASGLNYLITGVGTGGHITGCAEYLKPKFPELKVFAVEPEKSQVIAGGTHTPHKLQGIGAGFIPEVLRTDLLDGTIAVSEAEAYRYARQLALQEGILVGASSGASLAAVAQKLPEISEQETVLVFCYDTGERYLSVPDFFDPKP